MNALPNFMQMRKFANVFHVLMSVGVVLVLVQLIVTTAEISESTR